jgi:hypothetical protein
MHAFVVEVLSRHPDFGQPVKDKYGIAPVFFKIIQLSVKGICIDGAGQPRMMRKIPIKRKIEASRIRDFPIP